MTSIIPLKKRHNKKGLSRTGHGRPSTEKGVNARRDSNHMEKTFQEEFRAELEAALAEEFSNSAATVLAERLTEVIFSEEERV